MLLSAACDIRARQQAIYSPSNTLCPALCVATAPPRVGCTNAACFVVSPAQIEVAPAETAKFSVFGSGVATGCDGEVSYKVLMLNVGGNCVCESPT